ncbi:MAG: hypothetical protein OXI35_04465 [Gemmatimonadota bacterium]|nr:hypothetical protein [Gemmatimonadota bacterium]
MKLNMSKPIVAVIIPAFIGIISCADNPIKSAGENAESGRSESAGEHSGNAEGEGHEGREGGEGGAGRLVASAGGDEGGEHGSGAGGNEGGEGGGGEGNETSGHAEGPEGGGGDPSSPILALDESFDGVVNGVRVAMSYDPVRRSFSGIVENTMALTACSVQIELNLKQGTRTVVELGPSPVGDLAPGASATTELLVDDEPLAAGVAFDAYEIHPEVFDCNCPIPNSSSGEGGEGSEGGDIAQPLAPDQRYDQTRSGARLVMVYSPSQDAFYGIVGNMTNQTLTRVRVEIHLTDQSGAITAELGPTTPTNLAPGKKLLIALPAAGQTFAGWSPHVEVGSGEGGEGGGGEGGGEHGSGAGGGEGGESHAGREGGSG